MEEIRGIDASPQWQKSMALLSMQMAPVLRDELFNDKQKIFNLLDCLRAFALPCPGCQKNYKNYLLGKYKEDIDYHLSDCRDWNNTDDAIKTYNWAHALSAGPPTA